MRKNQESPANRYYLSRKQFSVDNKKKGMLGEKAVADALSDFPVLCNITYGKRQKNIDHLVLTSRCVVFNECKNVKENFQMYYSWFSSHVVDRFADGLPVAQYYTHTLDYPVKNIKFTLTIPYLNTEPSVKRALKGLKIEVIQTKKQLLKAEDMKTWYIPIKWQILSVINTNTNNNTNFSIDSSNKLSKICNSVFWLQGKTPVFSKNR